VVTLFFLGKGFIKDYREQYPDPKPPYTTVATIMKKLEAKGYVAAKMYGNTYEYRPKIKQEKYKSHYISSAVNHFFQNSYKEMVRSLDPACDAEAIRVVEAMPDWIPGKQTGFY
jgi:predicted transcriptional regulator